MDVCSGLGTVGRAIEDGLCTGVVVWESQPGVIWRVHQERGEEEGTGGGRGGGREESGGRDRLLQVLAAGQTGAGLIQKREKVMEAHGADRSNLAFLRLARWGFWIK